jgi:AraC-like DNA-binding protein
VSIDARIIVVALIALVVAVLLAGSLWQRRARSALLHRIRPQFTGGRDVPEEAHFERLEGLMRERQLYRDPDLDPVSLGSALGLSRGQVRELISRYRGGSFHDYINDYRVETARRLLSGSADSRATVSAIGRQAGFRTRSSFYKAFRTRIGCNPGAYRRQAPS